MAGLSHPMIDFDEPNNSELEFFSARSQTPDSSGDETGITQELDQLRTDIRQIFFISRTSPMVSISSSARDTDGVDPPCHYRATEISITKALQQYAGLWPHVHHRQC